MEIFAEEHGRSTMRESKRNVKEDRGKEVTKGDEREEGERERERGGGAGSTDTREEGREQGRVKDRTDRERGQGKRESTRERKQEGETGENTIKERRERPRSSTTGIDLGGRLAIRDDRSCRRRGGAAATVVAYRLRANASPTARLALEPPLQLLLALLPPSRHLLRPLLLLGACHAALVEVLGVLNVEQLIRPDADFDLEPGLGDEGSGRGRRWERLLCPLEERVGNARGKALGRVGEDEALEVSLPLLFRGDTLVDSEIVRAEELDEKRLALLNLREASVGSARETYRPNLPFLAGTTLTHSIR